MNKRDDFVNVAISQVGEKETPINQIKYNDWYYGYHVSGNDYPWCDVFVSWCAMACGILDILVPMMSYVPCTVNWYKERGQYYSGNYTPKKGDLAIFSNESHIGIVEYYDGRTHTIEGNKSDMVKRCDYNTYGSIIGYCSVDFEDEPTPPPVFDEVVLDYQQSYNKTYGDKYGYIAEDGLFGSETENSKRHVYLKQGMKNNLIGWCQCRLKYHKGYELGTSGINQDGVDDDFGQITHDVVMEFQYDNGLMQDGIIGYDTISLLF